MIAYLLKLKTLLQSKIFIISLCLINMLFVYVKAFNITYDIKVLKQNKVIGVIKDIDDKSIVVGDTIVFTDTSNLKYGYKVSCIGSITVPNSNTNFNMFNYRNYLASNKIFYRQNGECSIISKKTSFTYKIKNMIIKNIDQKESKRYLNAFILGITDYIDKNTNTNYRINGINHLFSISGTHVSFILLFLYFIKYKFVIAIILLFYLHLLGFPPSMMRAVIFYIFLLINKKLNINKIYLFIYLVIIMLFYNPYYIFNIGFIYSYTISFFLILFSDTLFDDNYLKSLFKTSVFIFIITIPINIQNNFYLNFITPILNLFFIPFISFILFPMSFITLIFPFFDGGFNLICSLLEHISNWCAINFSLIKNFHYMNIYMIIIYYVIIFLIMYKVKKTKYKYIGLMAILLLAHYFYPYMKKDGLLLVLDVGQGDSILISYPHNSLNILIDTGGYYSSNIVNNITIPTLRSLRINKLDFLIITHGDFDHMGEAINLINNYKVDQVIFNNGEYSELELELIKTLEKKNIPYYQNVEKIDKKNNKLYFLNNNIYSDENSNSIVIYTMINNYNFLLMGDAGIPVEQNLLNKYNLSNVDILKVGHHGSNTSSGQEFINYIKPKFSIISVGKNNHYGHPHNEVLDRLNISNIYRTDLMGGINFRLNKKQIKVKTVIP